MKKMVLLALMLNVSLFVFSQSKQLQGKVMETETKKPLGGATISVVGKTGSALADADGLFSIKIEGKTLLIISYVGYKTQTVDVTNKTSIEVLLEKEVSDLNDVVVIGYGKQRRKDITSSITSISGKDIKNIPVTNLNAAMQGRVPGMQVTNSGNEPGAGTNVKIRGINSINQYGGPLYVVDGVLVTGDIREINPNDVESIDVLKDASAAAIYGSRASEGVIIVTTKKAASGRSTLNYDGYFGWQKLHNGKGYDFVDNIDDYVRMRREAKADEDPVKWAVGKPGVDTLIFSGQERQSIADGKWYDWEKAVTQVAPIKSHTLSYGNGVGKNKFYLSGNYLNQDGIIKGSNFKRYSVQSNVESEATSKLKLGINSNFSHTENDIVSNEVYYNAITMSPLGPIFDAAGDPSVIMDNNGAQVSINNPLTLTMCPQHAVVDRNIISAFADYKIIKDLSFRTSLGLDVLKQQKFEYYPRSTYQGYLKEGLAKVQNWGYRDYTWENTLTYDLNLKTDHSFNFLAGHTYERRRQEWDYVEASHFPIDNMTYKNLKLAAKKDVILSDYFNRTNLSYLGRVIYKYKGKYIVNASVRRDASSRFGETYRWGTFPAVSSAWRLIDEPFMNAKIKSVINDAKIRVGYGVVGNQEVNDNAKFFLMKPAAYPFNGSDITTGFMVDYDIYGNPKMKWEKQYQFNVGFDLAVFNSRVKVTFDYYNKNIRDLLMPVPLAPSTGVGTEWMNISKMATNGIDLGLKLNLIQKKDFDWQMDWNWSKYTSEIKKLLPGRDSLNPYMKVGEAPNSLLVDFIYDGLYQKKDEGSDVMKSQNARPGDVKVKDLDNNGKINQYDQAIVGRTVPKGYGGLWNYLRYKNFSMTIFATYAYGHQVSNKAYQDYLYCTDNRRRVLKEGLNFWTPTNTNTDIPRPNMYSRSIWTLPSGTSNYIVQKGDFIRIRNISLAYDFSQTVLAKTKAIRSARVYTQVQEPFMFTKYKGIDPEINVSKSGTDYGYDVYPRATTYLIGLQLGF